MNIREFTKPATAKKLNESLAQKFGARIDVDQFTTEQLQDARNKIRTKLSQVETTESFEKVQNETYQKNKMFLDVLNAAIGERGSISEEIDAAIANVNEGKEDEAEIVVAAKDMVNKITSWMEDTAQMQTESMLELSDAIRDELGVEKAQEFVGMIKPVLETLYQTLETTREALTGSVGVLTGENQAEVPMGSDDGMGDEMGDMDADMAGDDGVESEFDLSGGDEFGAAAPAAGGAEDMGRAKRESKDYSAKKAAAGKDIGKPGKNFSKIADKAGKEYGSKAAGERVAGAVLKNLRSKKK